MKFWPVFWGLVGMAAYILLLWQAWQVFFRHGLFSPTAGPLIFIASVEKIVRYGKSMVGK